MYPKPKLVFSLAQRRLKSLFLLWFVSPRDRFIWDVAWLEGDEKTVTGFLQQWSKTWFPLTLKRFPYTSYCVPGTERERNNVIKENTDKKNMIWILTTSYNIQNRNNACGDTLGKITQSEKILTLSKMVVLRALVATQTSLKNLSLTGSWMFVEGSLRQPRSSLE